MTKKNRNVGMLCVSVVVILAFIHRVDAFIGDTTSDPNSFRASRLLYSPRDRVSHAHNKNMNNALARLRKNHQQQRRTRDEADAQQLSTMQTDVHSEEVVRRDIDETQRSLRESCHSHHLQKCGAIVLDEFSAADLTMERKCRIRENFLTCMIKMNRRPCRHRFRPNELNDETLRQFRQQILSNLWSVRGCILGIEVP